MSDQERWQLFPIILSDHKPAWKQKYLKQESSLKKAIGVDSILKMNHIGSTAIPGLISKPTIDVLIEIRQDIRLPEIISTMKKAGYRYTHKPDNPAPHMMFIKGYTRKGFKGQAFHVHIRYPGDWDEIVFRDYLLSHPEVAHEYGKLKLELKNQFEHDRDAYTNGKTDFIKGVCSLARQETPSPDVARLMTREMIAPCGMNCSLCVSHQALKNDLNSQGFNKRYCPGCLPRGKNCTFLSKHCRLLAKGSVRFCFECSDYPCTRLRDLDSRYRSRYHMSQLENLNHIKENGFGSFLEKETCKWSCTTCSGLICCHNGLCLNCDFEKLRQNKKYCW